MRFVTNLNLNQNQLINGTFEVLASDPNTGNFDGRLIFNSTEGTIKVYDDTLGGWRKMLTGVQMAESDTSDALTLSESNGVVTITANKATSESDGIMSAEDKSKLDAATAADSHSTLVIRDVNGRFQVATPNDPLDAANKSYVDSARSGLDVKQSVHVATVGAITLSTDLFPGEYIDGHQIATGDRVLVKNQDTASENGIYEVQSDGSVVRAPDADTNAEVSAGMFCFVSMGDVNHDSGWVLITDGPINLGVTGLEFSLFSVAGNLLAGDALSKDGDVLNVNVDGTSIEVYDDALRIASGAAGAGLSASVGVLSVNTEATGGIEVNGSDNLAIKIDPAVDGLTTTANGLALTSDIAGSGLGFTDGVVDVKTSTTGGLEVVSDELAIKINHSIDGLTTDGDGLKISSGIAGDGLTYTNGVLSVDAVDLTASVGNGITGTLAIENGGTSSTSADGARYELAQGNASGRTTSNPVLARIVHQTIGNNDDVSFDVYHNFGTRHVIVQVYDVATYDTVIADVTRPTVDKVNISFSVAPDNGAYTVVITGWDDWY